jgi:ATP-dependent DNA ligase
LAPGAQIVVGRMEAPKEDKIRQITPNLKSVRFDEKFDGFRCSLSMHIFLANS